MTREARPVIYITERRHTFGSAGQTTHGPSNISHSPSFHCRLRFVLSAARTTKACRFDLRSGPV